MDRYRDTTKSIQQIGKELEVATILEGGVQRSGNRIRINMQLIDAANDKHLWAETYDREMTAENLFAIQSEIAREVVSALDAVLSEQDHTRLDIQPTTSLEAYGEFVLGRQAMAERTVENFDEAISHFEKAIELDPDYAMPYVGLANSIQLRVFYIRPRQDVSEVSEQVQELIDKALSLNPLSGEAWAALGLLRKTQGNNEEAEKYYQKAIDLSPNYPSAYQWYSQLLSADESKRELALQYIRKATELDPLADILKVNLANQYRLLERRDEMYDVIKQGHARNPDFLLYYIEMTQALKQDGRFGEALRWSLEGVSRAPNHPYPRINACYLLINLAADQLAEQCLVKLLADFPGQPYKTYSLLSDLHTLRGDYQNALAIILEHYPEEPDKWDELGLAWAYLEAGKVEDAREIANRIAAQYLGNEPQSVPSTDIYHAFLALYILRADERMERAGALGRAMLETMKSMDRKNNDEGYGFADVETLAVIGDRQGAVAALREAIDSGWRLDWRYLRLPEFDQMREKPEWNAMLDELETDIRRQREWFLAHRDDPLD
jgi:tetratricopeptide (TPR) repeat protein